MDQLTQLLAALRADWLLPYLTAAVAVCSLLDATLPQPAAGSWWLPLRKVISFVAFNFAHAANGRQPDAATLLDRLIRDYISRQAAATIQQAQPATAAMPPAPTAIGAAAGAATADPPPVATDPAPAPQS